MYNGPNTPLYLQAFNQMLHCTLLQNGSLNIKHFQKLYIEIIKLKYFPEFHERYTKMPFPPFNFHTWQMLQTNQKLSRKRVRRRRKSTETETVPVAERVFLPVGQRQQLWRSDEHRVLTALRLIDLDQPRLVRPLAVHLQAAAHKHRERFPIYRLFHQSQLVRWWFVYLLYSRDGRYIGTNIGIGWY